MIKKRDSNSGFTLVELLVTIVILGIITGIALPLVRNIQSKNDDRKYTLYAESLLASAKLYNDSYSEDMFGHKEVGRAYITYNQMKKRDLLKDIEIQGITCNSKSTYVRVIKIKDKYGYASYLGCGSKSKIGSDGFLEKSNVLYPILIRDKLMNLILVIVLVLRIII